MLDAAIRARARSEGKNLNEVAVEALAEGLLLGDQEIVRRDLSDVVGTWKREAAMEAALSAQRRLDRVLWK